MIIADESMYWCWSRMDYSLIREIDISASFVDDNQVNDDFSVIFETNGTHAKCVHDEDWAQLWWNIENGPPWWDMVGVKTICGSSTTTIAQIHWVRQTTER